MTNLELEWSYNALWSRLVLPAPSSPCNSCWRQYTLTVDAMKMQLPSRNIVSLALDGWTSTCKFARMSVIASYMNCNWALWDLQLTFDEVDGLLFSYFESWLRLLRKGQHTGAQLAVHVNEVLHWFKRTNGRVLEITTDNTSSNYMMPCKLQSSLQAYRIEWPALRNHIPCMVHIIQLALGAFISTLGVKGHTESWEGHERDEQLGENEGIDIGKSQRLHQEGNAWINTVSAVRPGLAKIIKKVHISWYFGSPETDSHMAANAHCIDYADTWSLKWVHWLSNTKRSNRSNNWYRCEDTAEFDTWVTSVSQPMTRIDPRVAQESGIQWILASLHNSGWMDHRCVWYGSSKTIAVLDPVDVKTAYGWSTSRYHCLQWYVRSYGWCYVSFR